MLVSFLILNKPNSRFTAMSFDDFRAKTRDKKWIYFSILDLKSNPMLEDFDIETLEQSVLKDGEKVYQKLSKPYERKQENNR